MGYQPTELHTLVNEIKAASASIEKGDARTAQRCDEIERSVNELFKRVGRPGGIAEHDDVDERKSASELCFLKHDLQQPKVDVAAAEYVPSSNEIDEAMRANRAMRALWRHGDINKTDAMERKSLSAFSLGNSGFLVAPELSSQVLRCLTDPTDLTGMMNRVAIGSGSVKFLIDNTQMEIANWACETSCFHNNPMPDLTEGLGELEIKAETLRFVACATSDLLMDSAFNVEQWLFDKVSRGFRMAINNAVIAGDGIGKPLGILNPAGGVPICDVSVNTPPSQFTWQDLVMLKYQIPIEWHAGGSFLMNQKTFALLLTMSDAIGRPLLIASPTEGGQFLLNGSPIVIASQMPDCLPGATPIAFGNWRQGYMIVDRRALTMLPDPYSAGFCTLFRFETRIGGAVSCPNAIRLLRVR